MITISKRSFFIEMTIPPYLSKRWSWRAERLLFWHPSYTVGKVILDMQHAHTIDAIHLRSVSYRAILNLSFVNSRTTKSCQNLIHYSPLPRFQKFHLLHCSHRRRMDHLRPLFESAFQPLVSSCIKLVFLLKLIQQVD